MATNKRRKLDGENSPASPATPVMSAFQRLRALQAASKEKAVEEKASSSSSENVVQPGESETTPDRAFPRRKKRGPAAATVQQDAAPLIMDDDPNLEMQGDSIPPTPILSPLPGTPRLEATTIKPRQIIQHSSFKPNKKNFQSKLDGQIRILTSDGERLVVLGSFGIKVEEGEATIAGATLTPLDPIQWVHAPHCHALPVLRTSEGTIIELHPHPGAQSLRQLAKLNPVFGKLWNESDATFQIIFSSDDVPKKVSLQELVSAPEWNKKLAGLVKAKRESSSKSTNPPIIFLCGPKSSGKSTFGRLLANRLITDRAGSRSNPWTPILLLDIDPGQPEFSPPGVISLVKLSQPNLSPSFCHPSTEFTVKSHAIAAVTPALDPDHFLQCVLDLFYVYQQLHSSQLLIINTPGWIQGTGLDILSSLITSLVPTEVIYLSQDGPEDTVATLQTTTSAPSIFSTLPSSPLSQSQSAEPSRTALSLRIMSTLSYFHFSASTQTWTTQPLSSVPPYRVSYSPSQKGFLGVLCYDHQPSPSLLSEAINGTVLALVRIKDLAAFRPLQVKEEDIILAGEEAKIPMINNSLGTTLDPGYCELVCLVLVRGVNIERKELQLLAPPGGLGDVKGGGEYLVLVAGRFDTPVWSYSEELYKRGEEGDGVEEGEEEEEREVPWVEVLKGSEKRSVGSKVWRVRRDLGRNAG